MNAIGTDAWMVYLTNLNLFYREYCNAQTRSLPTTLESPS